MKKNGFTLVEMLTVIIILVSLGLISIFTINKIVKRSGDDLYDIQVNTIKEAARNYAVKNGSTLGASNEITICDLKRNNLIDEDFIDPRTEKPFDESLIIKIINDNSNYKNVGYVAGKGENEDRLITVLGTATGFDRREVLIDLNNIEDPDELNSEGQKKLDTYKIIQSIEGKVYQIPNMEWEKDFFLGDLVTLESDGIYEDKRIIQAKEIYEKNNKTVELGFGDKVPSLGEEIKRIITRPIN